MAIKRAMIPLANDFTSFPYKILNSYNKNKFILLTTKLNNTIGAHLTIQFSKKNIQEKFISIKKLHCLLDIKIFKI